jgi:hypothetical protein
MNEPGLQAIRKTTLVVLFVPSVQRDGRTAVDQDYWVAQSLATFGELFGGATAFPRAQGVWRDDERGGVLINDEPVILHCYTTPDAISNSDSLQKIGNFCRTMGREARQGEIGLVIGDEYFAFTGFQED